MKEKEQQSAITNKFLTMNNCERCDKEGIVSSCCLGEIKFISNGAAKCSKCKKFCKIDYCPDCKEKKSAYIIPNENIYEQSLLGKEQQQQEKQEKALFEVNFIFKIFIIFATILFYILLYFTS